MPSSHGHLHPGRSLLLSPDGDKCANRLRLVRGPDGGTWVEKDLSSTTMSFGVWPLSLNELLASELAKLAGANVPEVAVERAADTVRSPWRGNSVYQLSCTHSHEDLVAALRSAHMESLCAILVFAHWIGDVDRTIHHMLLDDSGEYWGVDFQYCGWRPGGAAYPEDQPDVFDVQHMTCVNAFRYVKPFSPAIVRAFPHRAGECDVFPWNASMVLFLHTHLGRPILPPALIEEAAATVRRVPEARISGVCESTYDDPEVARNMTCFLCERREHLLTSMRLWVRCLREVVPS